MEHKDFLRLKISETESRLSFEKIPANRYVYMKQEAQLLRDDLWHIENSECVVGIDLARGSDYSVKVMVMPNGLFKYL